MRCQRLNLDWPCARQVPTHCTICSLPITSLLKGKGTMLITGSRFEPSMKFFVSVWILSAWNGELFDLKIPWDSHLVPETPALCHWSLVPSCAFESRMTLWPASAMRRCQKDPEPMCSFGSVQSVDTSALLGKPAVMPKAGLSLWKKDQAKQMELPCDGELRN